MNPLVRLVFFNPVMNYAVWSIRQYIHRVASLVPAGTTLLDVGAGECQYKPFFSHTRYRSTDWCGTTDHHRYSAGIDYICPADELPLENESVHNVLCTQVLEHVRHPEKVIRELARVLKSGGHLFLTVPQSWEEHEQPYDFHRFTRFALQAYADDHGFEVVEIRPQGGRFLVIGFFLAWSLPTLFKNAFGQAGFRFALILFYPLNFLIALLFFLLDPLDRKREFTMNYECIFRKK